MTITQSDLNSFHLFAQQRLATTGAESIRQLVEDWITERELAEIEAAIREGQEAHRAGLGKSVEQVRAEIYKEMGWD